MPSYSRKIEIPGKSAQELYDKVSTDIDRFLGKVPIGKYDVDCDPSKKEVRAKASMFSATLRCEEGGICLEAKLSLLAAAFRGKLDAGIDKWLAKAFGRNVGSG